MVRNNVSLTVELVFVDRGEGCDQILFICFSILSKWRDFISLLIDVIVGNDMRELDVKSYTQYLTEKTVKAMFIIHC